MLNDKLFSNDLIMPICTVRLESPLILISRLCEKICQHFSILEAKQTLNNYLILSSLNHRALYKTHPISQSL